MSLFLPRPRTQRPWVVNASACTWASASLDASVASCATISDVAATSFASDGEHGTNTMADSAARPANYSIGKNDEEIKRKKEVPAASGYVAARLLRLIGSYAFELSILCVAVRLGYVASVHAKGHLFTIRLAEKATALTPYVAAS